MKEPQIQLYEFGEFRVDAAKRLLTKSDGEPIPLTPKVFDTLLYLVQNCGKVIEKDELMRKIWKDSIVEENNLTQNISILRRIFGEKPGEHRFIVTIAGHGYRFVPAIRQIGQELADGTGDEVGTDEIEASNSIIQDQDEEPDGGRRFRNLKIVLFAGVILLAALGIGLYFRRPSATGAPIRTIAVLPFRPLLAENRDEALELGMAETLISKLSSGDDITVRPLSSVRRYSSLEQDSLAAGRELNVEAVLDGTIQTSGERIRLSVRLFRISDGKQLWAAQFDERLNDIFVVQDSISEKVATALKIRLGSGQMKHYTDNVEAYQFYMKGRYFLLKRTATPGDTEGGVSYFQLAIEADPYYALAYAGLADAYRSRSLGGEAPSAEFMPKAKAAAMKAIEIDDTLAEAHAILGHIIFLYDWDWIAAETEYKRALELDPNSPDALQFYALFLSCTGRHSDALEKIRRAREIDPVNLRINALEGMLLLYANQTDEAVARLQKTLEMDRDYRLANILLARAYIEKGMLEEGLAVINRVRENAPVSTEPIGYGEYALINSGKRVEALASLSEMLELSKSRWVPPYNIALVYSALGQKDNALDYLEKGLSEKDVRMVFLKVEPQWKALRTEPRFQKILQKMRL